MSKFGMQAPWTTYMRQVEALFGKDPEILVDCDDKERKVTLYVESQEKAEALGKILPPEVEFGNVKLAIGVVPANPDNPTVPQLFAKAFKGNPAMSYVKDVDSMGFAATYVVFQPEVVQFFNDDLGDVNGLESTLYEDIAEDVFSEHDGVFFCTDIAI